MLDSSMHVRLMYSLSTDGAAVTYICLDMNHQPTVLIAVKPTQQR